MKEILKLFIRGVKIILGTRTFEAVYKNAAVNVAGREISPRRSGWISGEGEGIVEGSKLFGTVEGSELLFINGWKGRIDGGVI